MILKMILNFLKLIRDWFRYYLIPNQETENLQNNTTNNGNIIEEMGADTTNSVPLQTTENTVSDISTLDGEGQSTYEEIEKQLKNTISNFNNINVLDKNGTTFFWHIINNGNLLKWMGALLKMGKVNLNQIGNTETGETHLQLITKDYSFWGGPSFVSSLTKGLVIAMIHQFPEYRLINADEFILKLKNDFPSLFAREHTPYIREGFNEGMQLFLAKFSTDTYALMIFHSDEYLKFKEPVNKQSNEYRFFALTKDLPIELKMKIARHLNPHQNDSYRAIVGDEAESAFQRVASSMSSM